MLLRVLVPLAQMLVAGLGTSGGGSVAPGDLALVRFGGMASSPLLATCLPTYEPTATYLSVSLVMDELVLQLLSHSG